LHRNRRLSRGVQLTLTMDRLKPPLAYAHERGTIGLYMAALLLLTSLALAADDFDVWKKSVGRQLKQYVQIRDAVVRLDAKLRSAQKKSATREGQRALEQLQKVRDGAQQRRDAAFGRLRKTLEDDSTDARLRMPYLLKVRSDVAKLDAVVVLVHAALTDAAAAYCAAGSEADLLEMVEGLLGRRDRFSEENFGLLRTALRGCEYRELSDAFLEYWLKYAERFSFAKLANARLGLLFYRESFRVLFSREAKEVYATLEGRMQKQWAEFQTLSVRQLFLAEAADRFANRDAAGLRDSLERLVVDMLETELNWYRQRGEEKSRGKSYLARASYRASVYLLLDALEKLHRGGHPEKDRLLLLSAFLDVSEPEVVKLGRTGVRSVTLRRRLCGEVLGLLRRWTRFSHLTWAEEWVATLSQEGVKIGPDQGDGRSKVREKKERPTFYGIQADGGRIAFVLDFSASMKTEGMDLSLSLKNETANFFRAARRGTLLNLIPYSSSASIGATLTGSKSLYAKRQEAGKLDSEIASYLSSLKPRGVTAIQEGFRVAFALNPVRDGIGLDEIVFVSDGMPTDKDGHYVVGADYQDLQAYIIGVAKLNGIRIHTVSFPGANVDLLKRISSATGGQHRMAR
jgi:hypothetical protein